MLNPDLILDIHLFPTCTGGRKSSTPNDKFSCMFKIRNEYHDCRLLLQEVGALSPGQHAQVPVKLLQPELLRNRLSHGQEIILCEGHREIGKATVVNILLDANER